MRKFKSFISDESGNFAVMFALGSLALMAGTAAAINIAGMQSKKSELQNHLDTAALAAVTEYYLNPDFSQNTSEAERDAVFRDIVIKTLEQNGIDLKGAVPQISISAKALTVSANIPFDMKFGNTLSISSTNIGALSEVAFPSMTQDTLEIALVLDNTESMNAGGKMTALRQGARDFINTIEALDNGSTIALVPFARYVDVGVHNRDAFWITVPEDYDTVVTEEKGSICHFETREFINDGITDTYEHEVCSGPLHEVSTVLESRWFGCVGVRENGLHLQDVGYNSEATRIQGLHKFSPKQEGWQFNENAWCTATIQPLTDDYNKLDEAIGHLYGTDRTYIPAGLIWGQRVLSPQAPFTESTNTASDPKRQVMILMSDGTNTAYLQDGDEHESIPYVQDLSDADQANGVAPPNTNEETAILCASSKARGIEIYTIAFQVNDISTQNLLRNCASSPSNYINAASNAALIASFENISESFESNIRLMR